MMLPGFNKQSPRDVVQQAIRGFLDDDMLTYAAALSYQILLALFPFLIFLLTVLGTFGYGSFFDQILEQSRVALPSSTYQLVVQVVSEVRQQSPRGLLSFSLLFTLWAASAGLRSVANALNVAYDVKETRPALQRIPLSVVYTLGVAIIVLAATGLLLLGPRTTGWLAERFGLPDTTLLWTWLRWPVVIVLLLLTFAVMYKVAPNIQQPFRYVTPGSVVGVACWILIALGFSAYIDHFGNYGATYGSLGGIIVLMLYFYVSSIALLFGAEMNAVIHPAEDPKVEVPPGAETNAEQVDKPSSAPTNQPTAARIPG